MFGFTIVSFLDGSISQRQNLQSFSFEFLGGKYISNLSKRKKCICVYGIQMLLHEWFFKGY